MFGKMASGSPSVLFSFLLLAGAASNCPAQPCEPSGRECSVAAGSFVTQRLAVWQKRLHLEDWNISVTMARASELKPRTLGNVHWDSDTKTAVIHVLDPVDYHMPYREMLDDMEFTVVHELVHLTLAPPLSGVQRNEASRRDEEYAVNHITDALLGR
jgi:hypothetical protein